MHLIPWQVPYHSLPLVDPKWWLGISWIDFEHGSCKLSVRNWSSFWFFYYIVAVPNTLHRIWSCPSNAPRNVIESDPFAPICSQYSWAYRIFPFRANCKQNHGNAFIISIRTILFRYQSNFPRITRNPNIVSYFYFRRTWHFLWSKCCRERWPTKRRNRHRREWNL